MIKWKSWKPSLILREENSGKNFTKERTMTIRRAVFEDLDKILAIYEHARNQMRLSGNPNQWGTGNPPVKVIENDIRNGNSYVLVENDAIYGVFALIFGMEPTYAQIENGAWLNDAPYATIHRVAGSGERKGILRCCLSFCEAKTPNIRVDTHADNHIMQHLLETSGYLRCGIIHVADGSPRIAYQKTLQDE